MTNSAPTPAAPPAEAASTVATARFLPGFALLLACWLAGEALVTWLPFALPGAIAGMLLLLGFCLWRRHVPANVEVAARNLLDHLSLLFIPAGVGLIEHTGLLHEHGPGLVATLVLSTLVTMAVTALTLDWLQKRQSKGRQ